jgi:hypothetical protein
MRVWKIRYAVEGNDDPDIELDVKLDVESHLLSICCMATKEVWQSGERLR